MGGVYFFGKWGSNLACLPPQWHALTRDEQAKYYEMARKERQLHMQMYPGWSSRQNYSQGKKKKRNRDKNQDGGTSLNSHFSFPLTLKEYLWEAQLGGGEHFRNAFISILPKLHFYCY